MENLTAQQVNEQQINGRKVQFTAGSGLVEGVLDRSDKGLTGVFFIVDGLLYSLALTAIVTVF